MGAGRYIFQFFHEVDVDHVIQNGPRTFNHLILMEHEQAHKVPLTHVAFWVLIRADKILHDMNLTRFLRV